MVTKIKMFGFKNIHNFIMSDLLDEVLKILCYKSCDYEEVFYTIKEDILYYNFLFYNRGEYRIILYDGIRLDILYEPNWKDILIKEEEVREEKRLLELAEKKKLKEQKIMERELLEYKRIKEKYGIL